jgi:hypothetical protein
MPLPGFNVNGAPEWAPDISLQRQQARQAIDKAVTPADRQAAITKWQTEALADLELSLDAYRERLKSQASPMKALRRSSREQAARAQDLLGTLPEVEAWYLKAIDEAAKEMRKE